MILKQEAGFSCSPVRKVNKYFCLIIGAGRCPRFNKISPLPPPPPPGVARHLLSLNKDGNWPNSLLYEYAYSI